MRRYNPIKTVVSLAGIFVAAIVIAGYIILYRLGAKTINPGELIAVTYFVLLCFCFLGGCLMFVGLIWTGISDWLWRVRYDACQYRKDHEYGYGGGSGIFIP